MNNVIEKLRLNIERTIISQQEYVRSVRTEYLKATIGIDSHITVDKCQELLEAEKDLHASHIQKVKWCGLVIKIIDLISEKFTKNNYDLSFDVSGKTLIAMINGKTLKVDNFRKDDDEAGFTNIIISLTNDDTDHNLYSKSMYLPWGMNSTSPGILKLVEVLDYIKKYIKPIENMFINSEKDVNKKAPIDFISDISKDRYLIDRKGRVYDSYVLEKGEMRQLTPYKFHKDSLESFVDLTTKKVMLYRSFSVIYLMLRAFGLIPEWLPYTYIEINYKSEYKNRELNIKNIEPIFVTETQDKLTIDELNKLSQNIVNYNGKNTHLRKSCSDLIGRPVKQTTINLICKLKINYYL